MRSAEPMASTWSGRPSQVSRVLREPGALGRGLGQRLEVGGDLLAAWRWLRPSRGPPPASGWGCARRSALRAQSSGGAGAAGESEAEGSRSSGHLGLDGGGVLALPALAGHVLDELHRLGGRRARRGRPRAGARRSRRSPRRGAAPRSSGSRNEAAKARTGSSSSTAARKRWATRRAREIVSLAKSWGSSFDEIEETLAGEAAQAAVAARPHVVGAGLAVDEADLAHHLARADGGQHHVLAQRPGRRPRAGPRSTSRRLRDGLPFWKTRSPSPAVQGSMAAQQPGVLVLGQVGDEVAAPGVRPPARFQGSSGGAMRPQRRRGSKAHGTQSPCASSQRRTVPWISSRTSVGRPARALQHAERMVAALDAVEGGPVAQAREHGVQQVGAGEVVARALDEQHRARDRRQVRSRSCSGRPGGCRG